LGFGLFAVLGLAGPLLPPNSDLVLGRALGQVDVIDATVAGRADRPLATSPLPVSAATDNAETTTNTQTDGEQTSALPVSAGGTADAPQAPPPYEVAVSGPEQDDNRAESPSNAAEGSAKRSEATRYTVQPGDTLNKIAARFETDPDTLVSANGLGRPDHIQVGQSLVIPAANGSTVIAGRAPAVAARTPQSGQQEAFIVALAPAAQASQRATGVPSSVTLAQAILETYWGTSYLAREANNYFGIKAYARPGSAGIVWIDAWEVENGVNVTRSEPFRKYEHPVDSLVDHGRFFLENSRYASALQATDDPREFARRINAAGYATDPAYANKLISYMDRYNLYQYDLAGARS
jgi:flagellum-specific peptidoglycan hydrolase FlgJ